MESYEKVRTTKAYQAFRSEGYPTHYEENRTHADLNLEMFEIGFVFLAIVVSVLLILPGFRGKQV